MTKRQGKKKKNIMTESDIRKIGKKLRYKLPTKVQLDSFPRGTNLLVVVGKREIHYRRQVYYMLKKRKKY